MRSTIVLLTCATIALASPTTNAPVNSTTCNGKAYQYLELAGFGFTAPNSRDKYGDTAGGIGSSAAIDPASWRRCADNGSTHSVFTGTLWALPDRGWNTEGTLNYQPRVHKFDITFSPDQLDGNPNLQLSYKDSVLFTDPAGTPLTGLDADAHGPYMSFSGFPDLPSSTYTGDGFGGAGPGGHRVSLDSEGLVLNPDGSFWVSDEYGPFVYHFSPTGQMIAAIRPPEPFIPKRNGSDSFSANSPPRYDPNRTVIPKNNPVGRNNNQGFEALTASPDGKSLYVMLQSALNQDGGLAGNRRYTRLLHYDVETLQVKNEYVVPLPLYTSTKVAAQSEMKFISDTQFMVLARDSGAGRGQDKTMSVYRHVDIFDISNATDVYTLKNMTTIAPNGTLDTNIVPATYCSWLDYNVNSQLAKFNLHNGGAQDAGLLNEKWESLALVPAEMDDEYYLFSLSDNDFITQDGYLKFGQFQYKDESGYDVENQALVFKVKLPSHSKPRIG